MHNSSISSLPSTVIGHTEKINSLSPRPSTAWPRPASVPKNAKHQATDDAGLQQEIFWLNKPIVSARKWVKSQPTFPGRNCWHRQNFAESFCNQSEELLRQHH